MKKILIVVDMQVDFVSGSLGSADAEQIVAGVCARIERAKADGETVLLTLDTHAGDYLSTQEGEKLPVLHCVSGTPGWMLDPRVAKALDPGMPMFEKNTFGSEALGRFLARMAQSAGAPDGKGLEIELCGLCSDICVISNALLIKATLPEARLSVDARLCAGVTPASHEAALSVMRTCQIEIR
ncbi:MAG: isochorismatase family cysteine hydrolase [Clostridia bacterium]